LNEEKAAAEGEGKVDKIEDSGVPSSKSSGVEKGDEAVRNRRFDIQEVVIME
jgi:hypothetical protein